MKKKVGLIGAFGRMGTAISHLLNYDGELELYSCYGRGKSNIGIKGESSIAETISKSDIIIDFSSPELMNALLQQLDLNPKPLVSGTTGHDNFEKLEGLSRFTPVLWSANMSLGINILLKMIEAIRSDHLNNFDIAILESHHNKKKDKPSGTANLIKSQITSKLPNKQIDICSLRMGDIPGQHGILFADQSQTIKVEHTALNRKLFAEGAIFAAKKIIHLKRGFYSMNEIL